ncbi:MAG: sodium ion-translocating decarboxylase subunit beta [Verrucomicrobiota bacterium]|nr:sodium ion-translocating decarboxylase subunit beta [Verrucomicrobiota bacterium]
MSKKTYLIFMLCIAGLFCFSADKKANTEFYQLMPLKDGSIEIVYKWKDPAVVYEVAVEKGEIAYSGRPLCILSFKQKEVQSRSKAHIKIGITSKVINVPIKLGDTVKEGDILLTLRPEFIAHDSAVSEKGEKSTTILGLMNKIWHSTGLYEIIVQTGNDWRLGIGRIIMIFVGILLLYLAVFKGFEPLLLVPIGFGAVLANIPIAAIAGPDGILGMIYKIGVQTGVFPLMIFMGVGAMTDFGPLIANPKTAILGAAAQTGIFFALVGALALSVWVPGIDFGLKDAASIGIIGGADGPTAIFLTSKLSPSLLGSVAVAAYSYMALVPIIQPPIMRMLTTVEERKIKMKQLRNVSKLEKISFPLIITLLCAMLLPDAAPLIGMLMFGNFMKECGVVDRLSDTTQNALINIVTIMLGLAVGSKLSADKFLNMETLGIVLLGLIAFSIGTTTGVLLGKLMSKLSGGTINPLIGAAGVSAVPMAARVVNKVGLEEDHHNFLLMHAMGPNVAGVIGSAVAAGVLLNALM